jgi:hypothetical protein
MTDKPKDPNLRVGVIILLVLWATLAALFGTDFAVLATIVVVAALYVLRDRLADWARALATGRLALRTVDLLADPRLQRVARWTRLVNSDRPGWAYAAGIMTFFTVHAHVHVHLISPAVVVALVATAIAGRMGPRW